MSDWALNAFRRQPGQRLGLPAKRALVTASGELIGILDNEGDGRFRGRLFWPAALTS